MRKLMLLVMVIFLTIAMTSQVFATEIKPEEELVYPAGRIATIRRLQIETGEITTPQFLGEELGFWGSFAQRLIGTGNVVEIMDGAIGRTGFQMTAYDVGSLNVIVGIVPEDESAQWFYGVAWKGFPLLGDLLSIFKRFDPGIVNYGGNWCFSLSFEFRAEEIAKR